MKQQRSLAAGIAALALVVLAACSGGGGGGSSLPPAASDLGAPNPGGSILTATAAPSSTTAPATAAPATTAPATTASVTAGIPLHVPTWAYDQSYGQGRYVSAAFVQRYATFAEGDAKAHNDCATTTKSCHSIFYFDPNLIYGLCPGTSSPMNFLQVASESWFVHRYGYTDASHRLLNSYKRPCGTVPVYLANNANPSVATFFRTYLQKNADNFDYYFMDDTKGRVPFQGYGPSGGMCGGSLCTTTQEYQSDSAVVSAHGSFANAMNHVNGTPMQLFFNGVAIVGGSVYNLPIKSASSHFVGAVCESCIVAGNTIRPTLFSPVLTAMAQLNAIGGTFVQLNTGSATAGSAAQIAQRTITTAIDWLGFNGAHSVVWADLEDNTSNLAVWPESALYPTSPLQSMSSSSSDIAVATGVWRREFAACYSAGNAIGPCAALVNSTGSAVVARSTWLHQTYGHLVTMAGGDIQNGGTIALASARFYANSTTIPAGGAILLSR